MFYDRFEELCAAKGVKPGKACTEMGLSRSLAAKWKSTKTEKPSADALSKMSEYFGMSINEILGLKEEEAESNGHGPYSEEDIKWLEMFRNASPSKRSAILVLLGQEDVADPGAKG